MRIAVNASVYDHRASGLGAYARHLVVALKQLHPDLVVYTSRLDDLPWGSPIRPWGEPSRGWRGHLWRLLWTQTALPLRAAMAGARVLLNAVPEGPLRGPCPQVTVVHDILPLAFPTESSRQRWYYRHFVPAVLRASAIVIAVSAQTRHDLLASYGIPPDQVVVVPPGVDHARFRSGHPDVTAVAAQLGLQQYVLFVGNLRPHKNLPRLLEAFAMVDTHATLALVGFQDPRYGPSLVQRATALGIANRVRFLGFVPDAMLPALYAGALLVVIPSLYEGFGLPVLEAMACGTPVIASTGGGLREAAGDAALLVDPLDVEGLSRAMQWVLDDPRLRDALRARGIAHAAKFQWADTARHVLSVLTRVLA